MNVGVVSHITLVGNGHVVEKIWANVIRGIYYAMYYGGGGEGGGNGNGKSARMLTAWKEVPYGCLIPGKKLDHN